MKNLVQILLVLSTLLLTFRPINSSATEKIIAQQESAQLEKLEAMNHEIINAFKNGKFGEIENMLSASIKMELNTARIEQTWKTLIGQFGAFQKIGKSKTKTTAEGQFMLTEIVFEKENLDLSTSLDSEDKIRSLNFTIASNKEEWEFPLYGQKRNALATSFQLGETKPLSAELLEPKKGTKSAIVVFVHGSGPNDMDESLGPNKMFKDLAYGLANRDIASIRYHKRTYDYQSAMMKMQNDVTIDLEVTDDAILAIQHAKTLGYKKVILAGHSLGGHIAPKIADREKVDGVIVLAGNSSPLVELLVYQFEYLSKNDSTSGITDFQINAIRAQVKMVQEKQYDENTHSMMLPLGMSGIYWKSLEDYNPVAVASKQKQPYLILNGTRDYQVTVEQAKAWKNGNKNAKSRTKIFEGLNHMFFGGQGLCLPAEYEMKAHTALKVVEEITNWINTLD